MPQLFPCTVEHRLDLAFAEAEALPDLREGIQIPVAAEEHTSFTHSATPGASDKMRDAIVRQYGS